MTKQWITPDIKEVNRLTDYEKKKIRELITGMSNEERRVVIDTLSELNGGLIW